MKKKEEPIYISNKESLKYEKALGSDIASVQQIDPLTSFYNSDNNDTNQDEFNNLLNDKLPLQTHYISHTPENILKNKDVKHAIQISGFCNIMATKNKEEIKYQEDDRYSQLSKEQREFIDFIQVAKMKRIIEIVIKIHK